MTSLSNLILSIQPLLEFGLSPSLSWTKWSKFGAKRDEKDRQELSIYLIRTTNRLKEKEKGDA